MNEIQFAQKVDLIEKNCEGYLAAVPADDWTDREIELANSELERRGSGARVFRMRSFEMKCQIDP